MAHARIGSAVPVVIEAVLDHVYCSMDANIEAFQDQVRRTRRAN